MGDPTLTLKNPINSYIVYRDKFLDLLTLSWGSIM